MAGIQTFISIVRVDGEVMLHDGSSGWARAYAGMVFPSETEVTIKTGSSGSVELLNARGRLVRLEPNSMQSVSAAIAVDDLESLHRFRITARDIMAARSSVPQRLAPAY